MFRSCTHSVDVRGHVKELDVHGVFEVDGSGTHVVVEVVVHVLKRNLTDSNPFGVVVVLAVSAMVVVHVRRGT